MIHTEIYNINGHSFTKTWSDTGRVMRDGIIYDEANDPTEFGRTYEEVPYSEEDDEEITAEEIASELEGVL